MASENDNCSYCSSEREPSLSEHAFADDEAEDDIGKALSSFATFGRMSGGLSQGRRGSLLSIASSGTCSTNGSEFSDSLSAFSCDSVDGEVQSVDEDISETKGFDDSGTLLPRKVVRFGSITVREYAVTIGAHGDLKCPITLSWEYRQRFWRSHASYSFAQEHKMASVRSPQRRRSRYPGVPPPFVSVTDANGLHVYKALRKPM